MFIKMEEGKTYFSDKRTDLVYPHLNTVTCLHLTRAQIPILFMCGTTDVYTFYTLSHIVLKFVPWNKKME